MQNIMRVSAASGLLPVAAAGWGRVAAAAPALSPGGQRWLSTPDKSYAGQVQDEKHLQDSSAMASEMDPEAPKGEWHNPEAARVAAENPSVDSMRHMAGKLNQAVGGSYDFPKTGGESVRKMASEIMDNAAQPLRHAAESAWGAVAPEKQERSMSDAEVAESKRKGMLGDMSDIKDKEK